MVPILVRCNPTEDFERNYKFQGLGRPLSLYTNTNAKLEGFFSGLEVSAQTSNAPIDIIATMFGQSSGSESRVNLQTSNGAITAHLGLVSDYENNILRAVAQTSGASLTIHASGRLMLAQNSSFFLDASTSVGPATAYLYPEYEGLYDLWTTRAEAQLRGAKDLADPSGKGRHRTVAKKSTGRHAQGRIYWSHDGKPAAASERGSVKITTSVSPVVLYI
ncbi:hypothetical protein MVEN_02210000 [Mycena venus]|uniref:Uncharacterized protein n=1 Tax=Mycena venus TaxID=2733690 RepID=A0A8H7CFM4_9AGAR|nr:hypothetical protein MVEN_02210000 [Mycena venus]